MSHPPKRAYDNVGLLQDDLGLEDVGLGLEDHQDNLGLRKTKAKKMLNHQAKKETSQRHQELAAALAEVQTMACHHQFPAWDRQVPLAAGQRGALQAHRRHCLHRCWVNTPENWHPRLGPQAREKKSTSSGASNYYQIT